MSQSVPSVVKSADRVLDVLECIANEGGGLSFVEIASKLAIPNSSLFYLLGTLNKRGYIQQDGARSKYVLGPAFNALASAAGQPIAWAEVARPLVDQVWEAVQETTSYFEPRGDEVECLVSKLAPHPLVLVHTVGQRAPLHLFSGGKLVLAAMSDKAFELYLKRTPLVRFTPYTPTTAAELRKDIQQVRKDGFALSRQEHTLGVVGISVGLEQQGSLIGSIGLAIPAVRFDDQVLEASKAALAQAARDFAEQAKR